MTDVDKGEGQKTFLNLLTYLMDDPFKNFLFYETEHSLIGLVEGESKKGFAKEKKFFQMCESNASCGMRSGHFARGKCYRFGIFTLNFGNYCELAECSVGRHYKSIIT